MSPGGQQDKERYKFRVDWSKPEGQLLGYLNGEMVFHEPWVNQAPPLKHIFLWEWEEVQEVLREMTDPVRRGA